MGTLFLSVCGDSPCLACLVISYLSTQVTMEGNSAPSKVQESLCWLSTSWTDGSLFLGSTPCCLYETLMGCCFNPVLDMHAAAAACCCCCFPVETFCLPGTLPKK